MATSYGKAKARYERRAPSAATPEDELPHDFRCMAAGCLMAGSINSSNGRNGWCAYHYGKMPEDLHRITAVMTQYGALRDAIIGVRTLLGCSNLSQRHIDTEAAKWSDLLMHEGFERIEVDAGGAGVREFEIHALRGAVAQWLYHLERTFGELIDEELSSRRTPAQPTRQEAMAT